MALLVHIKKGGKLFVNGAILENATGRTTSMLLRNEAVIMRGEDILAPQDAGSPAARAYCALQCAYLFPDRRERYIAQAMELVSDYVEAAPSAAGIVDDIRSLLRNDRHYAALKPGKALIEHENRALLRLLGADTEAPVPAQRHHEAPRLPEAVVTAVGMAGAGRGQDP